MGRSAVVVRSLCADEVGALAHLWQRLLDAGEQWAATAAGSDVAARVRQRLQASQDAVAAGLPATYRLLVAEAQGAPVGFASLSVVDRGLMAVSPAVMVDVLHVDDGHRRHGAGTALLRAAARFAEDVGAQDVLVQVPPGRREVHRFFARFGFVPLVVRRSASVPMLRRRLGLDPRLDPRETTSGLSPVQRTLRRRALLAPRRPARH